MFLPLGVFRPGDCDVHVVYPGTRCEEHRRRERYAGIGSQTLGETAPGPILGASYQAGTQGMALDRAAHSDEADYGDRFNMDTAGRHRCRANRLVPAQAVGSLYPAHQPQQSLGPRRTHDELPLFGQNAVSEQADRVPGEAFLEHDEKRTIVQRTHEDGHVARAAIDDVEEGRWWRAPRSPGDVEPPHLEPLL